VLAAGPGNQFFDGGLGGLLAAREYQVRGRVGLDV
jgi:hypothetical protein